MCIGNVDRLQIVATNKEPVNKHVIWLKGDYLKRWTGAGWKNIGGDGGNIEVIDNLTSSNKDKALSANQGRVLLDKINSINTNISTDINVSNLLNVGKGLHGYYDKTNNKWHISHPLTSLMATSTVTQLNYGETFEVNTAINVDDTGHVNRLLKQKFIFPQVPTIVLPLASNEQNGLMSSSDKVKLDSLSSGNSKRTLVNHLMLSGSTYNAYGEITSDIVFNIEKSNYIEEYMGEFIIGTQLYTIMFPSSVIWDKQYMFQTNKKYQFRILNNLGTINEFPLE